MTVAAPERRPAPATGRRALLLESAADVRLEPRCTLLAAPVGTLTAMIASGDELRLADDDGREAVVNVADGSMHELPRDLEGSVTAYAAGADGRRRTAAYTNLVVRFWGSDGREAAQQSLVAAVASFAVSPDGRRLVAGLRNGSLVWWDFENGRRWAETPAQPEAVTALTFLDDDVLLAGGANGWVSAWDAKTQRCLKISRPHERGIAAVIAAEGGHWYLTIAIDGAVRQWSRQHRDRPPFMPHLTPLRHACLANRGRWLVTSHVDGAVQIWDMGRGGRVDSFATSFDRLQSCAAFDEAETLLAVDARGRLKAYAYAEAGAVRYAHRHAGDVYALARLPATDELLSVAHDGDLKVWSAGQRAEAAVLSLGRGPLTSCAASPKSRHWAMGAADGRMFFWDAERQQLDAEVTAHRTAVTSLCFHPDENLLVSCSWDLRLLLWTTDRHLPLLAVEGHSKQVTGAAFSPCGRWLHTASLDGTLRTWDVHDRTRSVARQVQVREAGHGLTTLSASPDGRTVVTGSSDGRLLRWRLDEPGEPTVLADHHREVVATLFARDGACVVSADRSGRLAFTAVDPAGDRAGERAGDLAGSIELGEPINCLAWADDDGTLAVGTQSGIVRWVGSGVPPGRPWLTARAVTMPRSLWLRGAPPLTRFAVACPACRHEESLAGAGQGQVWKCGRCRAAFQLRLDVCLA